MTVKNPELIPLFEELKKLLVPYEEYFSPRKEAAGLFGKELMATLKGKSCFYIKELSPDIEQQIRDALDVGLHLYQDRDWA